MPSVTILPKNLFLAVLAALGISLFGVIFAQEARASTTVAAAGDISCDADAEATYNSGLVDFTKVGWMTLRCQSRKVAALMDQYGSKKVLALGDLIQGQDPIRAAYGDFHSQWEEVEGRIRPTVGNHDYLMGYGPINARPYFNYWRDRGLKADVLGQSGQGWASWRMGSWYMLNLNSNCFTVNCALDSRQMDWLLNELRRYRASKKSKCLVAYFHHPLFSAGVPAGRSGRNSLVGNLWSLLYLFGADLVLNGHQHFYERHRPMDRWGRADNSGITEVISGTGGTSLYRTSFENGNHLESSVARTSRYGATFLQLGKSGWRSVFRDIKGDEFDRAPYTRCHGKAEPSRRRKGLLKRFRNRRSRLGKLVQRKASLVSRARKLSYLGPYSSRLDQTRGSLQRITSRIERERQIPLR